MEFLRDNFNKPKSEDAKQPQYQNEKKRCNYGGFKSISYDLDKNLFDS